MGLPGARNRAAREGKARPHNARGGEESRVGLPVQPAIAYIACLRASSVSLPACSTRAREQSTSAAVPIAEESTAERGGGRGKGGVGGFRREVGGRQRGAENAQRTQNPRRANAYRPLRARFGSFPDSVNLAVRSRTGHECAGSRWPQESEPEERER